MIELVMLPKIVLDKTNETMVIIMIKTLFFLLFLVYCCNPFIKP